MEPIVLFRDVGNGSETYGECEVAKKYFKVVKKRSDCVPAQRSFSIEDLFNKATETIVIGRYSVLPFYRELEDDLKTNHCVLINSWYQHNWIASFSYYFELGDCTPRSWLEYEFGRCQHPGPFVVKGATNSRKEQWNRLMYAEDRRRAAEIGHELALDSLIGTQQIVYREFVPLKTFGSGFNGLPYTNEWRFFYYKTNMLSYGYYWSCCDHIEEATITNEALEFAQEVAEKVSKHVNFFVLDIAEKAEGGWILIEVNDGQMSGLSENSAHTLYVRLKTVLEDESAK